MNLIRLSLLLLILSACGGVPKNYIRSADAPNFGSIVTNEAINSYLDSALVPKDSRFFPLLDSIPNRSYYRPTALLFKGKDNFINYRLCNYHYKDITKTIENYDKQSLLMPTYPLSMELKALENVTIDDLPDADYYLVFYWSLSADNLNWRNIKSLEKSLADEMLSLEVLYVNIDNLPKYKLTEAEFFDYMLNNRTLDTEYKGKKWFSGN